MLKDEIELRLLSEQTISGERLARSLGVTRAAVSKAIAALRQEGYEIDAQTNRGYRLISHPDLLRKSTVLAALGNHVSKDHLIVLDSVDSTNNYLRQLAASGAPEGTVVLADAQSAGRGRMGRSFVSAPGVGIYMSVLLRPMLTPEKLMTLTAQTAVAISDAIWASCGLRPQIKWVNDLLLQQRKICGILTELSVEAESGLVNHAIIGVGVNCNQLQEAFPRELQSIAGSIRMAAGRPVDRSQLAAEMIRQLTALPRPDWRTDYCRHCVTVGRKICIPTTSGERYAEALDIGPNAELLVRYEDGTTGSLNSGEVSLRSAAR